MSETHPITGDDHVLPFQVELTGVRGRVARLGPVVDDILRRHDYAPPVAKLLGEALALTALLGESLKFDGVLTLQAQGSGPVSLLVASFTAPDGIRGFAQVNDEALEQLLAAAPDAPLTALLGKGHLALTIDQGPDMDRYQGIVALEGAHLADMAHEYFRQSEQIATSIKLAVGQIETTGHEPEWRAGGIMIQHLAVEGGIQDEKEREARIRAGDIKKVLTEAGEDVEEAWSRATILLDTTEDHELLDPMVSPEQLLFRLFHEDGVRVYDAKPVIHRCRCSAERSQNILKTFSEEELADMVVEGEVTVKCEFCSTTYRFDPETLDQI